MAKISHTKIKQPSFGEKRPKFPDLQYILISLHMNRWLKVNERLHNLTQNDSFVTFDRYIQPRNSQSWLLIIQILFVSLTVLCGPRVCCIQVQCNLNLTDITIGKS